MSSKIAEKISDAIHDSWTDPISIADIVDRTIGDNRITRREVEQLRKDVETLKSTLEVVHVNLARAENEAASNGLILDFVKDLNEMNAQNGQFWLNEANEYAVTMNVLANKLHYAREQLWNTEKELNDLKKEINKESEFIEPAPGLNTVQALEFLNTTANPGNLTWTWTGPGLIGPVWNLTEAEQEPKSGGNSWLLALLVLVIITGGAALVRYLSIP